MPSDAYTRIRIGVGRPDDRFDVPEYLLTRISIPKRIEYEQKVFPSILEELKNRISDFAKEGYDVE